MNDAEAAQLQLKKKARRRLVGAIVFVSLAALVLPIVMDEAPKPPAPGIEISIPEPASAPAPEAPTPVPPPAESAQPRPPEAALAAQQSRNQASAEAQKAAKEKEKAEAEAKAAREKENKEKEARDAKAQEAARQQAAQEEARIKAKAQGQAASERDAQRAAAILSGRMPGVAAAAPKANAPVPAAGNGDDKPHIILIGAYANQANVANLRKKLAELKIKSYTEPLGNKTRVRAGPFANRAEAEAALAKMQKIIDVGGVVAAKP